MRSENVKAFPTVLYYQIHILDFWSHGNAWKNKKEVSTMFITMSTQAGGRTIICKNY